MTRASYDYYPTPAWCVWRLLETLHLPGGNWLEPAVGDGSIVRSVNAVRGDISWTTSDIRRECNPDAVADFVAPLFGGDLTALCENRGIVRFDVCITNPPYNQAIEFVEKARSMAAVVVMLLRVNWLSSEDRYRWLSRNTPDVYVLPNRPSFTGGGGDMTEYAWLVWPASGDRRSGKIELLATTPLSERRRQSETGSA